MKRSVSRRAFLQAAGTAAACSVAPAARELNRPLRWNPEAELFENDDEANQRVDRPRRRGFELPRV
ncbi:MAG: twin-arginine translocation signal domain-containing protein [Planctomycetota bacterium]|nr:MAG: twin-arginine translocation signal domain-containing protein [Planctomycetota bacterium]